MDGGRVFGFDFDAGLLQYVDGWYIDVGAAA
jgi:hypothetical protein